MTDPLLPAWFTLPFAAVLGALIGSFLNVVVWRVPRDMSVVSPRSACPRCEYPIAWYDNLPIVSYLALRGRCRQCRGPISPRYPAVEAFTAVAFALVVVGAYTGTYPAALVPLLFYWAAIAIALTLIDLEHHRLPNVIVLPAYIVTAVLLIAASLLTGEIDRLVPAAIGMVALGVFYFVLAIARPGGMGLGDVKLAGALGMLLGWLGWPQLIVGAFAAFLLGGAVGIVLMASNRATRKTAIPFGPFMLAGAAVGIFAGQSLAQLYLSIAGIT